MATYTENYNLKKPYQWDFYDVDDFNGNSDILDAQLAELQSEVDILKQSSLFFDCGWFDGDSPITAHNADTYAHQNMSIDGGGGELTSGAASLEEHETDTYAHQNLAVDGGAIDE